MTEDIFARGVHEYLDGFQQKLNQVDEAINQAFFQFAPAAAPETGQALAMNQ